MKTPPSRRHQHRSTGALLKQGPPRSRLPQTTDARTRLSRAETARLSSQRQISGSSSAASKAAIYHERSQRDKRIASGGSGGLTPSRCSTAAVLGGHSGALATRAASYLTIDLVLTILVL